MPTEKKGTPITQEQWEKEILRLKEENPHTYEVEPGTVITIEHAEIRGRSSMPSSRWEEMAKILYNAAKSNQELSWN